MGGPGVGPTAADIVEMGGLVEELVVFDLLEIVLAVEEFDIEDRMRGIVHEGLELGLGLGLGLWVGNKIVVVRFVKALPPQAAPWVGWVELLDGAGQVLIVDYLNQMGCQSFWNQKHVVCFSPRWMNLFAQAGAWQVLSVSRPVLACLSESVLTYELLEDASPKI